MSETTRDTEAAFRWIVEILRRHKVPFQLMGGFAARVYGCTRNLADIDIDLSEDFFPELLPDIRPFIIWGPDRYVDENWDLLLITLTYAGQEIDLAATRCLIKNAAETEWHERVVDLSRASTMNAYGLDVPVIPKDELIRYKRVLGRDVDNEDLNALTA